ncbi:MAG: phasin family protein [bacterium]
MAKKKTISKAKLAAKNPGTADVVMESAHQIWLAGLGAFAKAQDEGGKIFDALVSEGRTLQSNTKDAATAAVDEVRGNVEKKVTEVKTNASQSFDKLESVFEDRVSRALNKLGVPTSKEIKVLQDRIEKLNVAVNKLNTAKPAAKKAPAKRKVAAKKASTNASTAKTTTAKKPAVKKAAVKKTTVKKEVVKKAD